MQLAPLSQLRDDESGCARSEVHRYCNKVNSGVSLSIMDAGALPFTSLLRSRFQRPLFHLS